MTVALDYTLSIRNLQTCSHSYTSSNKVIPPNGATLYELMGTITLKLPHSLFLLLPHPHPMHAVSRPSLEKRQDFTA